MTIDLNEAEKSALICCGENMPRLNTLTKDNVIRMRNEFLDNVRFGGAGNHQHIINVLVYMTQFIEE